MKKIILPLATIAIIGASFTSVSKKGFIPPGTVQINDTLYADEYEITNAAWQEYDMWTAATYGKNSKEHIAVLPDTLVWRDKKAYNEPYVAYYYRHPAYKEFPLVGITYEQVVGYCKWRTERVKTHLTVKKDFKHQNIEYRLPTKTEWEYLANSSAIVLSNFGRNEKGEYQLNCATLPDNTKNTHPPYSDVTAPVKSYNKNWLGLYNMLGNVAEMVLEKGISKGGGWKNNPEDCRPGKDHEYLKQNAWTGFRCVCVVRKM